MFFLPTLRLDEAFLPRDVVDLSNWRLDIPENSAGELYSNSTLRSGGTFAINPSADVARSTNAAKLPAELLAGYASPYFFGNRFSARRYMNLRCPIFGATSSPTALSNNARSELRGLLTGGGPNSRSQSFQGIHRPRIEGRWRLVESSSGAGSGTSDVCQIHPATQESGYTGPVNSGSVYLIVAWRKSSGNIESSVRDVTNPDNIWDSGQTPANNGRPILVTDFRVGDELEFVLEWDCRGAQHFLRYTLQQFRNDIAIGGPINFNHQVQAAWAARYHYFKAGAYSSTNILDSADAKEDPAPAGFPSRNSGGLLLPQNVTDVNHVAFSSLSQQLMNPGGLAE